MVLCEAVTLIDSMTNLLPNQETLSFSAWACSGAFLHITLVFVFVDNVDRSMTTFRCSERLILHYQRKINVTSDLLADFVPKKKHVMLNQVIRRQTYSMSVVYPSAICPFVWFVCGILPKIAKRRNYVRKKKQKLAETFTEFTKCWFESVDFLQTLKALGSYCWKSQKCSLKGITMFIHENKIRFLILWNICR